MIDIEKGIENRWPQEWFPVFAKMKFFYAHRYHNMEPYYYIVRNKIDEEIERCQQNELLAPKPAESNYQTENGLFYKMHINFN